MEINRQVLQEKWAPVLDSQEAGSINDRHRRAVTAVVLENQEKAFREERQLTETAANATADVANWDPVLISLVRRATPAMLAFDLVGVQPMTGPTGLIFAMKAQYTAAGRTGTHAAGAEALFDEANTEYSGALSGDTGSEGSSDPFAAEDTASDDADTVPEYQPG